MDDGALATAMTLGDPRGLEGAYRRYADRLHAYSRSLVGDGDTAADVVHDTFVIASQRVAQLREPDRLRPWLYTIARNESLRHLRARKRTAPLEAAGEVREDTVDLAAGLEAARLRELVHAALAGLGDGDRQVLELSLRHGLEAADIAATLGVSVKHAHARLSRARAQLSTALGVLLVARSGTGRCPELAALLEGWDGQLTPLVRKRLNRHIEACDTCADRRRQQLAPSALLAGYTALPFPAVAHELWPRLRHTCFEPSAAAERAAVVSRPTRWDRRTGFPQPVAAVRRRAGTAVAAAALLLLLLGGSAVLLTQGPLAGLGAPAATPPAAGMGTPPPALTTPAAGPLATPTPEASPSASPSPSPEPPPPPPPSAQPPPPPQQPPPVLVPVPAFSLSCAPGLVVVVPGLPGEVTCTIVATGGFAQPVELSCRHTLQVIRCLVTPGTVTPPADTAQVNITWSGQEPGEYEVAVSASSAGTVHTVPITVRLPAPQ